MSWEGVDPRYRTIMEETCTAKEIDALKLKSQGYGLRPSARILGISRQAVRDRLDRAADKVGKRLAEMELANDGGETG